MCHFEMHFNMRQIISVHSDRCVVVFACDKWYFTISTVSGIKNPTVQTLKFLRHPLETANARSIFVSVSGSRFNKTTNAACLCVSEQKSNIPCWLAMFCLYEYSIAVLEEHGEAVYVYIYTASHERPPVER